MVFMATVLVVGATRGLGACIVQQYAADTNNRVLATARTSEPPANTNITHVPNIDLESPDASRDLVHFLETQKIDHLDIVIVTAGYFATESLKEPSYSAQERMYRTCVIGPTILVTALANKDEELLNFKSKIILVSSESGSIALRHESEGGGNYGHHASKAALNMSAKLLSLDLKDRGVAIATVHPGFMRTEMTRNVGFDKYWDEGGAVTPDIAAKSLIEWIESFDMNKTGQYWAPRGAGDIGTAGPVLGLKDKHPTPLQLPW
ncbi:oxidoreductase [Pyrenophora seminiperda CCB06]|uniref:Oxidoreductase n=1 Tax=Pyrenophora seminiperda CCB06 TaxID=1302712 RepID=A0A3M7M8G5_9PLEO|nr:oxidoreductase [Pyrenophora seminiperda CCB06]